MPSNTQNITPDITPTAAPTAMSITRHRSDPRVAHLVAVDAVGRACGACSEACAEESWRYGCEDGRAMMKSFWSMPRTVSWRSRRSPWAAPRPARPGQERRTPLYGRHVPMPASVSHMKRISSIHVTFAKESSTSSASQQSATPFRLRLTMDFKRRIPPHDKRLA